MKITFALACAFVMGAQCVEVRKHNQQHGWSLTTVSPECCQSKGGKLCGKLVIDCCQKGCQPGYFDSEWCEEDLTFNPPDCNTCTNACKAKGGKVCATNILTGMNIECCKAEDCVGGGLDASCKPNTSIDLGKCDRDSLVTLAQQ